MRAGIGEVAICLGDGHAVVAGFGVDQLLLHFDQAGVAFDHELRCRLVGFGHVLGDLGHAPLARLGEFAAVFGQAAGEQREQRGLARAIASHQADFFTRVDGGRHFVEQHFGRSAQGHVL
ncbi:hypothetical protein D3C87_1835470 [compost metagenome]